ncbi:MAG: HAMP domain-containing histidine kinase [Victivallales bacterium]|nr:HAMP domain-containing histidine kinase [Victivallales bacterium]
MQIFKNLLFRFTAFAFIIVILSLIFVSAKLYLLLSEAYSGIISNTEISHITSDLTILIGFTYFTSMAIFLIGIFFILKNRLAPLNKILKMTKKIASGDLTAKLKYSSNDEFGDLTRSVNHMKDRLQYSMVKLKNSHAREKQAREEAENANQLKTEFLEKVSKELRCPLMPIVNYSNVIISRINNGDYNFNLEKKIRIIRESADNIMNITSNLDEVSRLEAGKIELNKTEFDTSVFIEELVNLHYHSANERKLLVKTVYSKDFPKYLYTDKEILFHILSNILTYTIHYSPALSEITISSDSNDNNIFFIIENNIPGAHIEIISQIFQNSNERIANMTLHLSNARLFGIVSAISNAEFLNGALNAEITEDNKAVFRLIFDKSLIAASPEKK